MRHLEDRTHAARCLPVLLPIHRLRNRITSEPWRLLRVLLVRIGAVSAATSGGSSRTASKTETGIMKDPDKIRSTRKPTSSPEKMWFAATGGFVGCAKRV
jgi:hypothetical protein